jgi:hypothetical protein
VGEEPVPSLSVLCFRSYSGGTGEHLAAFIVQTKKTMTKTKNYPKMLTGLQTRARAASGDDGVVFDPAL